jgi:hypothetical protein
MTPGLTERLQQERFMVVAVDREAGRLRVRGGADLCTDLSCHAQTLVLADEGPHGLETLNPGDLIKVESASGRAERITVVRRVWEELASPEL